MRGSKYPALVNNSIDSAAVRAPYAMYRRANSALIGRVYSQVSIRITPLFYLIGNRGLDTLFYICGFRRSSSSVCTGAAASIRCPYLKSQLCRPLIIAGIHLRRICLFTSRRSLIRSRNIKLILRIRRIRRIRRSRCSQRHHRSHTHCYKLFLICVVLLSEFLQKAFDRMPSK